MSTLHELLDECEHLPPVALEELETLLKNVRAIAGDEGFWKVSAEETYMEWAKLLYLDNQEPSEIVEMMEDLYYAAASCYGG